MAKTKTDFSQYATAFFEIIEGGKGTRSIFVKELLKIGLSENGREVINEIFPKRITLNGKISVEDKAADRLRRYLRGKNDISDIADDIYAYLNHESYDDYIDELEEYEDSKIIKFAQELQLKVDLDDTYEVRFAIAKYYYSIIENASKNKSSNPSKTACCNDIINSYTITDTEKQAIINICGIILETLDTIRLNTKSFESVRIDIEKFAKSEENRCLVKIREDKQASLKKTLQTDYEKLENVCADMVKIITPQIYILKSSEKLCSIGRYISEGIPLNIDGFISKDNDEYKITSSAYKPHVLPMLIRQFESIYKTIQSSIKKL